MQKVTLDIPRWGCITVTTSALDATMAKYLPASAAQLRAIVQERSDMPSWYDDMTDVSTFLLILADWDCNVDDSPHRAY